MTFFAPNGQPIPTGTPAWNSAVARQTAKAAYNEQQLRRQEQGYADPRPPGPTWSELLTPKYSDPQPAVPVPRSRKLRRWAGWCMAGAVFFLISAWGYTGWHQAGWFLVDCVLVVACVYGWDALLDRSGAAAAAGD
jgi:uncharacterized membrane protein YccC